MVTGRRQCSDHSALLTWLTNDQEVTASCDQEVVA